MAAPPTLDPTGRPSGGLGPVLAAWLVARALVAISFGLASLWQRVITSGSSGDGVLRLEQGLLAWDGDWYRKIADVGYQGTEDEALRFFPLFPELGRLFAVPAGGDVRIGLIVVANVAAVAAGWLLWKLVVFETGDKTLAQRAVWLMMLFPSAFVLAWGYSESLFMVACVACFWALRGHRWELAAAAGFLASLCRPLGVLLAIPAAIEVGRWWMDSRQRAADNNEGDDGARFRMPPIGGLVAVVAPAVGLLSFGVGLAVTGTGTWDDPFQQQEQFRGDFVDPVTRLIRAAGDLFGAETLGDGLHLPFAIAFIALAVVCGRHWPASYTAFAAAILVASLAADNLNSLERYGLSAFPLALALASITRNPSRYLLVLIGSAAGLVGLTTLAWIGSYVP